MRMIYQDHYGVISCIPCITIHGQYVATYNIQEKTLVILELDKPVVPGTKVKEEDYRSAKPVFAFHVPNEASLAAIQAWMRVMGRRNYEEQLRVQSLSPAPQVYTLEVQSRRADRSGKTNLARRNWAIKWRSAGVPKGWPPCLCD